ncbi:DNA polymerase alpha catalytic subunit [Actinomortierella ambigua]|uniref:DNA polymerase n=1 Tax=Actinomortierella ambigua TaxID=1343610 RepID=A0A9P6UCB6_9FUNG|nr:DNA polymerase alpha catalytic subunit [Actinomortierella ambigua]
MSFALRDRKKRRTLQENDLALLRQARSGGSRSLQYQTRDNDIYDTVELDENMDRRLREDHDDFIEDDDGGGYVDNGQDEWEREVYSDENSDDNSRSKAAGKTRRGAAAKPNGKDAQKQKPANSIWNSYLKGGSNTNSSKPTAQSSKASADVGYLADILDTLGDTASPVATTPTRSSAFASRNTSKQAVASPLSSGRIYKQFANVLKIKDEPRTIDPPNFEDDGFDDTYDNDFGQDDFVEVKEEVVLPTIKARPEIKVKQEPHETNPFQDKSSAAISGQGASSTPKLFRDIQEIKTKEVKEKATVIKEETNDRKDWLAVNNELESAPVIAVDTNAVQEVDLASCAEPDGTLRMYWIDACDVRGVVYVFGKVFQRTTKTYVSCCAIVKNLKRNLFVLPRPKRVNSKGEELAQEVTMVDVYTELDEICRSQRISEWESKPVERKYAFEMPGIPQSGEYLKVAYSYTMPQLPTDMAGETFSHVFGANTSALEQFIVKRDLMGPCWLELKGAACPSTGKSSWCKLEVVIDNPKNIVPIPENPSLPPAPLCVLALNMRTIINPKDKANEVVSVSTTVYHEVRLDDTAENNRKNVSKQTIVRKLPDRPFPAMFTNQLEQSRLQARTVPSEGSLLSVLLSRISSVDPDVIVGHNFVQFDLDVLLHRMKANKTKDWSRLGRLHRTVWPKLQAGGGGASDTTAQEKQVMAGRLMCDTYIGAKEHVRAKSYGLTQLSAQLLNINREDVDYEKIGLCYNNAQELVQMLRHSDFDTYLCAELMFSLQLLPLSKQLTALSGNLWNMTLTAGRAVRNEYLLLHEFHKAKYICPDRTYNKDGRESMLVPDADGDQADESQQAPKKGGARRKPQYAGGLVLEPKKGFYDKFVLLLDFNSLYPSIIQEYNICFTTVKYDKRKQTDKLPEYPDPALPQGILPRLLATLVDRRREVKKLMKNATGAKYIEYDIRQKGLKLTANSMYGCLGAAYSRFYAKPLAMLITSRGREILQNTVDLARDNGLDVIYGDTDSIMINTNTNVIEEVRPMANNLKKIVNSRYRLLEIEMDGMYQRMLLLKKKKYAALSVVEKDGKYETSIETKGLDMVRRDWCGLSQDVSNYVLTQILSSDNQDREQVVSNIHAYLRQVADEVRRGLIPIEKYIVNKGLTKSPEDYADAKSQPHVQVALRLKSKGISFRQGDTVPYVICTVDNAAPSKGGYADRAYHPDEVTQPGSNLTIDYEYYLNQQIHPPLDRLCGPIEGTDARHIADCLGLDASKFRVITAATGGRDNAPKMLESQLPDEERYKGAEPLSIRCRNCQTQYDFTGLSMEVDETQRFGLQCPRCEQVLPAASLTMQLTSTIRRYITLYYEGWLVCDDQSCQNRTRMLSVNGRQCIVEGCRGSMQAEYTDAVLTKQLQYFGYLFDRKRAIDKLGYGQDAVLVRRQIEQNREMIQILKTVAERYLERDGRRFVDLSQLFSFFKIENPVTPPPSPPPPPSTTSTPTPTAPKMPDPIFSTSDSCTECKPEWPTLQGCLTYLPPNSVNLTVITSVLPFFNCICKDNMAPIDSLSTCSTCLRGTGQLAFLHPMFYNVTPADTKAYKQACADTKGGTVVPPDSAAAAGVGTGAWVMTIAVVAMGGAFLF